MVQINFGLKEISAKIVYYGPGMSGKTTNLEKVHELAPQERKGNMTSIATEGDRTLFFDFMPLDLGTVAGMKTKLKLYTVPGQIYYDATRKLVLQGVDGVIFVADSHPGKVKENVESLDNLETNLKENNIDIRGIPLVIQYNKRDLPDALPVEDMDKDLKRYDNASYSTASAFIGEGVMATLKQLSKLVLAELNKKYGSGHAPASGQTQPTTPGHQVPAPVAAIPVPQAVPPPKPAASPPPPPQMPVQVKPAASAAPPPPRQAVENVEAVKPQVVVESNVKAVQKKKSFFSRFFG